ncbi:Calcium-transporting ATPase [Bertholletia excelsa]
MGKGGQDCAKRDLPSPIAPSTETETFPAWAREVRECEENYRVERRLGLSSPEVEKRRGIHGYNELEKHEGPSLWSKILAQFDDLLVRILLGAAVVSFFLAWRRGEANHDDENDDELTPFVEPLVIFLTLILNAIVGLWQESNAERALEALREIQSENATVIRDGRKIPGLPSRELVPGDVVELKVGDRVPADMRVAQLIGSSLRVEQGSLTGESEAVNKNPKSVTADADIQGKKCMVFAGTTVVNGNCICLVTQTGMDTEIGKIQASIHQASQSEEDTPLKKELNEFGETLTKLTGVVCALVWLMNFPYFFTWDYEFGHSWPRNFQFSFEKCTYYIEIAVSLAVAAIPEGLPAVITTCLAIGTREMAKKKALVRKLPSVETLGCTTVICSDKTGTLTTNQMAVTRVVAMGEMAGDLRRFTVEGTSYDPSDGGISAGWPADGDMDENLVMMAKIAAVCNDAGVVAQSERKFVSTGMPTEAALKVLVEKMGLPKGSDEGGAASSNPGDSPLRCCQHWKKMERRIATLEFDRYRKSMGVIVNSSSSGKNSLLVKGAVENVLERSSSVQLADGSVVELNPNARTRILEALSEMSTKALRCLGFAYRDDLPEFETYDGDDGHPAHQLLLQPSNYSAIESKLIFVGLVGMRDPPREEVYQAIQDCKEAGIRVMVITGDNKSTAEAICREIGVFGPGEEDISSKSLTGNEFMQLNDKKAYLRQSCGLLFSRAEPRHKQEIVRLLKEDGEVVAMTGDGVNDAPALKLADIGIAMGITGTEVAKEASDMVLADDNFSTIVAAVTEGRAIYNNMKSFIRNLVSANIGEVLSVFLTAVMGIPEGLIPVQLLWVNLVTDGPPAIALGFNPPEKDIMKKPPRGRHDKLVNSWILFRYLVIGLYVGMATVGAFVIWYTQGSFLGLDLTDDGHTLVTFSQLTTWNQCPSWKNFTASPYKAGGQVLSFHDNPCDYFRRGKVKASTLSLSVLVAIEMFYSLSAISEDNSLIRVPPWVNPWLILAVSLSSGLHLMVLNVPVLARVFGAVNLSLREWVFVLVLAFPVVLIDEVLKAVGRRSKKGLLGSCWGKNIKAKTE